ncbi:MAG: sulfurtransferase TusA family protein [Burkholderiales bacterium]
MGLFGSKKTERPGSGGTATLPDGQTVTVARQVDAIGDSCPRPQLMTKKAMGELSPGQVLEVLVDNPTSMEALPPMCAELHCEHLGTVNTGRAWHVYLRKL